MAQAWMWPSCKHPRTHSSRRTPATKNLLVESAESSSSFTNSSSARMHHDHDQDLAASDSCLSTEASASAEDMADAIVHGLRSDRLRFEPRAPSSSILEKKPPQPPPMAPGPASFPGGSALALESADPYGDFRASMEEMMAAAHGAGEWDWDWLEKMLGWYLRSNGKDTHAAIVAAFVDLVVTITAAGSSSSGHSSFTLATGSELESSSGSAGGNVSFRLR